MGSPISIVHGRSWVRAIAALLVLAAGGCRSYSPQAIPGDEIIVAGERFHTGTRVITWHSPGGYDGYALKPPLVPRPTALRVADQPRTAAPSWTPRRLGKVVDQFVVHYDACGVSKVCFDVLQARGLSVHFLLDVDGTIYQTLDLQERALHATTSNDRSIGIEIANIGAYPPGAAQPLARWYSQNGDADRETVITLPPEIKNPNIFTRDFIGRPARAEPVAGSIHGQPLIQYDLTPEQYAALAKLTATLCAVFPRLRCDFPRDAQGEPLAGKLSDRELKRYRGILGHHHLQENKVDPGPAFQWENFLNEVRRLMK